MSVCGDLLFLVSAAFELPVIFLVILPCLFYPDVCFGMFCFTFCGAFPFVAPSKIGILFFYFAVLFFLGFGAPIHL